LLIDGKGYLFYLLHSPGGLQRFRKEAVGMYAFIDVLIREHIALFFEAELIVKV
jgi:hypothetical protein